MSTTESGGCHDYFARVYEHAMDDDDYEKMLGKLLRRVSREMRQQQKVLDFMYGAGYCFHHASKDVKDLYDSIDELKTKLSRLVVSTEKKYDESWEESSEYWTPSPSDSFDN